MIVKEGIARATDLYQQWQQKYPGQEILRAKILNRIGYEFTYAGDVARALEVFILNVKAHPHSADAYDSLAEALDKSGDIKLAAAMYARALEVDPKYVNAEFAKKFVAEHDQK